MVLVSASMFPDTINQIMVTKVDLNHSALYNIAVICCSYVIN